LKLPKVFINNEGAIVIGEELTADGHYNMIARFISHFHNDHIKGINSSIRECSLIIATSATQKAIQILGYKIPENKSLSLNYNERIIIGSSKITLFKAKHVFGSAQILVETDDLTIGYTGDFKMPGKGTEIMRPDILIMEGTYGDPSYRRPFKEEVISLFSDYVLDALSRGPVNIFAYHGKLQEAMEILRMAGIDAPFIANGKVFEMSKVASESGMKIGEVINDKTKEASEVKRSNWYVEFKHMFSRSKDPGATSFILSGWEFKQPIKKLGEKTYNVALSDHADFDELIEYVEQSSPRFVIVDGSRSVYAETLSREIRRRTGIKAIKMPF
jgi:Predicted exonuclease of the beta-lactamase fold involved in RNA processing